MTIPVPKGGGDSPEAGAYAGVIAKVWDVGNHVTEYEGHKEIKRQLCIAVELDGDMAGWIGENHDRQHVMFDKVNFPMFWPGKRNSSLWQYAEVALGEKGAVDIKDFEQIEGAGVQVGIRAGTKRSYVKTISPLMKGTPTPKVLGDYSEPWGLAKYLIEHQISDEDAARMKAEWAAEEDRKRAEQEAAEFSAPVRGADDIEPELDEDGRPLPF